MSIKYLVDRKYRMFSKKITAVQDSIWEYEFKVAKSRQVREGVRQDRDRSIESIAKIEAAIKGAENKEVAESLEKERAAHLDNVKRYEAQMRMIDEQISGVPASGDNPGTQGILDTIRALAELREMYKSYLVQI